MTTQHQLKIGGGGFIVDIDWPTTSSPKLVRTDTGGAYMWNASTSLWEQLCTKARLPSTDWGNTVGDPNNKWMNGCLAIASAPTNTDRIVMVYGYYADQNHYVFVSNDRGATFTRTGTSFHVDPNDGGPRLSNPKVAIDPKNADIWYVGTNTIGLRRTIDAGANWATVTAGFPNTDYSGGSSLSNTQTIAFDPDPTSARTTTVGGVTRTANIYAYAPTSGVYRSTDGGATWTLITGSRTDLIEGRCGIDGTYYYTADMSGGSAQAFIHRIRLGQTAIEDITFGAAAGGVWSVVPSRTNAANLILVRDGGTYYFSSGASGANVVPASSVNFTGQSSYFAGEPCFNTAGDVPWHSVAFLHPGAAIMDPDTGTYPNRVWCCNGIGVCYNDSKSGDHSGDYVDSWTTQSAGLSQLINTDIISVPGHNPIFTFWDRPVMTFPNVTAVQTTYWPHTTPTSGIPVSVSAGWASDWASSDPNFCIAISRHYSNPDNSCYSTDGGATWRILWDDGKWPWQNYTKEGGYIAASTPLNWVQAEAQNGDLHVTTDGGTTWTSPILASAFDGGADGMQNAGAGITTGWQFNYSSPYKGLAADRVAANTFYAYNCNAAINGGGFYRSTNSGISWHRIISPISISDVNKIKTVPHLSADTTGCFFFTDGYRGTQLRYCNNALATTPVLITPLGSYSLFDFGFGAVKPGNDFPSLFVLGFVNSVYGAFQCDASAADWAASGSVAVTWVPVGTGLFGSSGTTDRTICIAGDLNTYGSFYVGGNNEVYAFTADTQPPSSGGGGGIIIGSTGHKTTSRGGRKR